MTFDFDAVIDRRNSGSVKWTYYPADVIPMWVADMDFAAPEPVVRALHARVSHGLFGYEAPSLALREAVVGWLARHYDWHVHADELVFLPGLVSGLNAVCRAYGHLGDRAVALSPVYPPFLSAPVNQGMAIDAVPLLSREDRPGRVRYEIDFDALQQAITPRTSVLIHCHPHNPIGHEYSPEDNRRLAELCLRHGLILCSDEIHGDLMLNGARHVPIASLGPEIAAITVTLMAPSKTFNLPGLGCSFAVVSDATLRQRLQNADSGILPHPNALGLAAAEAAYSGCDAWLEALLRYLTANRNTLAEYLAQRHPAIKATYPQATYLSWWDCRGIGIDGNPFRHFLKYAKVALADGAGFGPGGEGFVRFNFGCPRAQMMEALERISAALGTPDGNGRQMRN
jgi:cystathionine beta-lyase